MENKVFTKEVIEQALNIIMDTDARIFMEDEWVTVNENVDMNLFCDDENYYATLYVVDEDGRTMFNNFLRIFQKKIK